MNFLTKKRQEKTKKCPLCESQTLLIRSSSKKNAASSLRDAQKIMLGGKRSPTEVCLACCKNLWPTSFMIRVKPNDGDAPFFRLAHSLASIGMDYSTAVLKSHVLKGQSHAHRILTGRGS